MNKQALNDLTDAEVQVLFLVRNIKMFDKIEISMPKQGQIRWVKISSSVGNIEMLDK